MLALLDTSTPGDAVTYNDVRRCSDAGPTLGNLRYDTAPLGTFHDLLLGENNLDQPSADYDAWTRFQLVTERCKAAFLTAIMTTAPGEPIMIKASPEQLTYLQTLVQRAARARRTGC